MARVSLNYYCENCFDPDEPCQYNGTWQGIATFYCPDCDSEFEVDHKQFSEDGDYVGEPEPEKNPRFELRGGHGNWAVFDNKQNRVSSWHSHKDVAEGRIKKLNESAASDGKD